MNAPLSTLDLQGYSYQDRHGLLPSLTSAFTRCGGWVLERKTMSATTMEFRFEIQLHAIFDLYGSLVGTGLELTRDAHTTLTGLCTSRQHVARSTHPSQILTIRLELRFLEDVTLHSLLMTGSAVA